MAQWLKAYATFPQLCKKSYYFKKLKYITQSIYQIRHTKTIIINTTFLRLNDSSIYLNIMTKFAKYSKTDNDI